MDLIQIKLWDNRTAIIDTGPIYDNSSKSLKGGKVGGFALDAGNIHWSSLSYRFFYINVSILMKTKYIFKVRFTNSTFNYSTINQLKNITKRAVFINLTCILFLLYTICYYSLPKFQHFNLEAFVISSVSLDTSSIHGSHRIIIPSSSNSFLTFWYSQKIQIL